MYMKTRSKAPTVNRLINLKETATSNILEFSVPEDRLINNIGIKVTKRDNNKEKTPKANWEGCLDSKEKRMNQNL